MRKILARVGALVISHRGQPRSIGTLYEFGHPLEKRSNLMIKRAFDLLLSSLLLLAIGTWMFPVIAILVMIDSKGPVFFLQRRIKKDGGIFTCIKFRTMRINEEADRLPACVNDRRITRLGRILRIYHIDELPQLLNVFWGDMSITGPRPHMISEDHKYTGMFDFYSGRYKVKPGITGLAQVLGYVGSTADPEKMKQRVKLDLYYIRHWSPALDFKIIFRTFLIVVGF